MRSWLKLIPPLLVMTSIAAAAHSAKTWKRDSRGVLVAIAQAPASARERKNPYEGHPDALLAGAKLYRRHCAECHGLGGWGAERAANLHASDVQTASPGELEWFLRNGNVARGMPSWSGLPEQRRWQIVAYLKTLR
ncbi:MAG TPA: cytochrome c [Candidatus Acidoferrum sp.]|nr:cytochrome c [Candidatus Acidoferrum sp.]